MKTKVPTPTRGRKHNAWLAASAMNLLVDYYPELQFRPYGSGCTRENTLPWLQGLRLGYLCIYAKGDSGYTSWDSSLQTRHTMLGQDMPAFYRQLTREAGTKLVLYFSGLAYGIAGERHPDWRMKNLDGTDKQLFQDFKIFHAYGNPLTVILPSGSQYNSGNSSRDTNRMASGLTAFGRGRATARCQARFRHNRLVRTVDPGHPSPGLSGRLPALLEPDREPMPPACNGFIKSLKPDCVYMPAT